MLVSFAVENWTCFRDRQEFSMEATARTANDFAFATGVSRYPRLNRVSAIYGPNGSGKSRFIDALAFMRRFVLESAQQRQAGDSIEAQPFLLQDGSRLKPCRFEIAFVEGETVYEYGFEVDSTKVRREWLFVRPPGGRMQCWLRRDLLPATQQIDWTFGPSLRGARATWRNATRPNALFVSTAVQLNSESLRPIVDWFDRLAVVRPDQVSPDFTSRCIQEGPESHLRVLRFLAQADIPFSKIRVREHDLDLDEMAKYLPEDAVEEIKRSGDLKLRVPEFGLPVEGAGGLAYLAFDQQSDGTQQIYALVGPWLDVIDNNRVVVVDELDRSLHPHLVRFLIGCINRPGAEGARKAQLVATVHDSTLLEGALDRTQVWFTEKHTDHAATLTPLSDYHPRKNESLRRGYLGGRYGAVPNVAEIEDFG